MKIMLFTGEVMVLELTGIALDRIVMTFDAPLQKMLDFGRVNVKLL
jgi:hypothetical protein